MKRLIKYNFITFLLTLFAYSSLQAQCGTGTPLGPNLICNGDFESGDSCFSTNYTKHSTAPDVGCGTCYRDWSNPDEYEVVTDVAAQFHTGFTGTPTDHTPGSGNHFMAIDGACEVGKKVWCQDVTIEANTNYFFTMWFTSLHSSNPALLQFEINGVNVGATQQLSSTLGVWNSYTFNWFSGATSGTISICIENMTVVGCGSGNDFAIDDISFTAGCEFAAAGPQPDLGPDRSLCLEGSPLTLNSGVTPTATMEVTWSTGATGTGLGAPYSIDVSSPGTYSVCVTDAGSCIKSDIVVVNNSFSVNLGPDVVLCNPTTATLNAGYNTISGVSYIWRKDGAVISGEESHIYTATQPGTYRAEVTIPGCGMQFDEVVITSDAPIPNHDDFCPPGAANLSVTGTGTYEWYTSSSGGSAIATGPTYNPTPASTTTYYVKDVSTFSYTVGESNLLTGSGNNSHSSDQAQVFDAYQTFNLDAVSVYADLYTAGAAFSIGVTLRDNTGALIWAHTINLFAPNPLLPNPTKIVVPVNRAVPVGTGLRLSAEGTSGVDLKFNQANSPALPYPYTVPGVMSITDLHPSYNWLPANAGYGYFYNWEISAGVDCERVPVIAMQNCSLPVDLLHFKAYESGENVLLQWATAAERNSSHFVVERSDDGIHFFPIGKIDAAGNANAKNTYSMVDYDLITGTVFYRLVQYDIDGSSHYSKVETIEKADYGIIVSPNPAHDQVTVSFSGTKGEQVSGQLYNALGKLVMHETFISSTGNFSGTLNIAHLASGVYYLSITGRDKNETVKIVKE